MRTLTFVFAFVLSSFFRVSDINSDTFANPNISSSLLLFFSSSLLLLRAGYPPFHDDNQSILLKKIKTGEFVFHPEYWDPVSDEAKALITAMLTVDTDKRITAAEALKHRWIAGLTDMELMKNDLNSTLDEIKKFNARRKLIGTIKAVMAATKMKLLLKKITKASMAEKKEKAEEEGEGGGAGER